MTLTRFPMLLIPRAVAGHVLRVWAAFLLGPAAEHVLEELELGVRERREQEEGPEGSEGGQHYRKTAL